MPVGRRSEFVPTTARGQTTLDRSVMSAVSYSADFSGKRVKEQTDTALSVFMFCNACLRPHFS